MGYKLFKADGVMNPAMVAIKNHIEIVDEGKSFCIDSNHQHYDKMKNDVARETRSARFVNIALPISDHDDGSSHPSIISICATHLHHTENLHGMSMRGVRLGEVRSILEQRPVEIQGRVPITIIATDFNGPRITRDYNEKERLLISESLETIVKEPVSDGVAEELEQHGFIATYDLIPPEKKPVFTHWTSTVIDFGYVWAERPQDWSVSSVEVVPSGLSDHLPIVHNLIIHR